MSEAVHIASCIVKIAGLVMPTEQGLFDFFTVVVVEYNT